MPPDYVQRLCGDVTSGQETESRDLGPLMVAPGQPPFIFSWPCSTIAIQSRRCARALKIVKFAVGIILFLWLLAGAIGAWMLDELDARDWKAIARDWSW